MNNRNQFYETDFNSKEAWVEIYRLFVGKYFVLKL